MFIRATTIAIVGRAITSVGAETNIHNSQEAIIDIKYFQKKNNDR